MAPRSVPNNLQDANAFLQQYEADLRAWVIREPVADLESHKAAEVKFFRGVVRFALSFVLSY